MPDRTHLCPLCPAAQALAGPPMGGPSIVCGVLAREGQVADGITEGEGHEHLTVVGDPSIISGFCCGRSVPPATVEQAKTGEAGANYGYCTIWQQEKERIWAAQARAWHGKSKLTGEGYAPPPTTPMDVALAEAGL